MGRGIQQKWKLRKDEVTVGVGELCVCEWVRVGGWGEHAEGQKSLSQQKFSLKF